MSSPLVKDTFHIDEDKLHILAAGGAHAYWSSCYKFYREWKDRPISGLSSKQHAWLTKIEEDMQK